MRCGYLLQCLSLSLSLLAVFGNILASKNYLEVMEGDVTYGCLPLEEVPHQSTMMASKKSVGEEFASSLLYDSSSDTGNGVSSHSSNLAMAQESSIFITVTSLGDEAVNSSACLSASPSSAHPCSLRSALLLCGDLLAPSASQPSNITSCVVSLPGTDSEILMDPLLGQVNLSAKGQSRLLRGVLSVMGNGCTVSGRFIYGTPPSGFLRIANTVAVNNNFHLNLENFTISNFGSSVVDGSGLFLEKMGSASLRHMTFSNNVARSGGGVFIDNSNNIDFKFCFFKENNATAHGGGVFILSGSDRVSFFNSTFQGNYAGEDGGGIHIRSSNNHASLSRCVFLDNRADEDGGALYLRERNDDMTVTDCNFTQNYAFETGGAVYIRTDNLFVTFESCTFTRNVVEEGGAAVGLRSNNYDATFRHCSFAQNHAAYFGGAMYLVTYNTRILLEHCHFERNTAEGAVGGAIFVVSLNWYFKMSHCLFLGNRAGQAGGAFFSSTFNADMLVEHTLFDDNSAQINGGAMYLGIDHDHLVLLNCTLRGSSSGVGGALFISSFNEEFLIEGCVFQDNSAEQTGGAIASFTHTMQVLSTSFQQNRASFGAAGSFNSPLPDEGRLYFQDCSVVGNVAAYGTGGFSVSSFNEVVLQDCDFTDNTAQTLAGGAFSALTINTLRISGSKFVRNQCLLNGGALFLDMSNSVNSVIEDSTFVNNVASLNFGGAVYIVRTRDLRFERLTFTGNSAGNSGGALSVRVSDVKVSVLACSFTRNMAVRGDGSALNVADGNSFVDIFNSSFQENRAPNGGGTVYWTYSQSEFLEPRGLWTGANVFASSNKAMYGKFVATQGISLLMGNNDSTTIEITDYSSDVPSFSVQLVDYYGQAVLSQSEREVTVSARSSQCHNSMGYLAGIFTEPWIQGSATFNRLQAYCAPGFELNLLLLYDSLAGNLDPSRNLTLQYRPCVRGEFLSQGRACAACPNGTVSLTEPASVNLAQLTETVVCRRCPEFSEDCFADQIVAMPGYWRSSAEAFTLHNCPFDKHACAGGTAVGDASCKEGFEGPLCAVCQQDFIYSPFTRTCTRCDSSRIEIIVVGVVGLVVVLAACLLWRKYRALKLESGSESAAELFIFLVVRSKILGDTMSPEDRHFFETQVENMKRRVFGLVRVFLTYFQIITILPIVLAVAEFELVVEETLLPFEITVNFEVSYFVRGLDSCSEFSQSWDLINSLYFNTIFPLVLLALLAGVYKLHLRAALKADSVAPGQPPTRENEADVINASNLLRKYVFISLLFLYMIFPSVSAVIFSIFPCSDVDPDDEEEFGEDDLYLNSDYSISCHSSRYLAARAYAICMVVLYPIGIPAVFMYALFHFREGIKARTREDKVHQPCYVIEFLWFPYSPAFWYFELLDLVYRVCVSGFLVLVHQGSVDQILVALGLTFVYAQLHQHVRPHEDKWVQSLKIISTWQIFLFLFLIMLIEEDVIVGKVNAVSILILVNCFLPIFVTIYYVISICVRYRQLKLELDATSDDKHFQPTCNGMDDFLTLALRTTIVNMRDSSLKSSRPTFHQPDEEVDNVLLVDVKLRQSEL